MKRLLLIIMLMAVSTGYSSANTKNRCMKKVQDKESSFMLLPGSLIILL